MEGFSWHINTSLKLGILLKLLADRMELRVWSCADLSWSKKFWGFRTRSKLHSLSRSHVLYRCLLLCADTRLTKLNWQTLVYAMTYMDLGAKKQGLTCKASERATMWTWSLSVPMTSTWRVQNCLTSIASSAIPCKIHALEVLFEDL